MALCDVLLNELKQEAVATRKLLERVPQEKYGWAPHPKSMSLVRLASHVAEIPEWAPVILDQEEFSMQPGEYQPWDAPDTAALVGKFDQALAQAEASLKGYPDDKLGHIWRMTFGDRVAIEAPRLEVLRGMVFNHLYHHRGQLTVYLRTNDVPLPAIYGPSADEQG